MKRNYPPTYDNYEGTHRHPEDSYSLRKEGDTVYYLLAMVVFVIAVIVFYGLLLNILAAICLAALLVVTLLMVLAFVFQLIALPYYLLRREPDDGGMYQENYSLSDVKDSKKNDK